MSSKLSKEVTEQIWRIRATEESPAKQRKIFENDTFKNSMSLVIMQIDSALPQTHMVNLPLLSSTFLK